MGLRTESIPLTYPFTELSSGTNLKCPSSQKVRQAEPVVKWKKGSSLTQSGLLLILIRVLPCPWTSTCAPNQWDNWKWPPKDHCFSSPSNKLFQRWTNYPNHLSVSKFLVRKQTTNYFMFTLSCLFLFYILVCLFSLPLYFFSLLSSSQKTQWAQCISTSMQEVLPLMHAMRRS